MKTIAVVDFGTGNLRSVEKALVHVAPKARVTVTVNPDLLLAADGVVFPGQGAIGTWLKALEKHGLHQVLLEVIASKPFLGICLGLQALYDYSEEDGGVECLQVLSGRVQHFTADATTKFTDDDGRRLKIPHMGWNQVRQTLSHPLWSGIDDQSRFYFVHSYCVAAEVATANAGVCHYGRTFVAAAAQDNVFAVQFHPEKSQHDGLRLLENFVQWDGSI